MVLANNDRYPANSHAEGLTDEYGGEIFDSIWSFLLNDYPDAEADVRRNKSKKHYASQERTDDDQERDAPIPETIVVEERQEFQPQQNQPSMRLSMVLGRDGDETDQRQDLHSPIKLKKKRTSFMPKLRRMHSFRRRK